MKYRVSYSTYAWCMTILLTLICCGYGSYCLVVGHPFRGWTMFVILGVTLLLSLFYAPLTLSVDEEYVAVRRPLATRRIPLTEIAAMTYAPPTMAEKRIVASGGFMGYWGWFHCAPIGKYFGYYGKSSETFLIKLRDGRQYMLGCKGSAEAMEEIRKNIRGYEDHR